MSKEEKEKLVNWLVWVTERELEKIKNKTYTKEEEEALDELLDRMSY